ncbi:MAG: nucleotidyl transferase AbiEii/AbiGii toxin family protein [Candidatus Omnitrophica bacterium]|nr:nucleotidyl transferase AbiEii/AbiGii toxin family protein [Candidatus Omnitrophota bacterium]MBU1134074.1 nucleotidyl transferase AbiEii/AbiGii toxin family protein [Candidatus Omnitrophota bacterium]MBU1366277.1 nucleotidyl transferase AbiEii/AbiGii toxin family protein [Candidatus Omnitrophota bacterium]MBU1811216.1 nucleotidyl transferase AbiEii/AbiGii toxin family protein [Candidatus Omnitrophota bacterium]
MFTKTLFGNTKAALAILGKSHLMNNAYLAGGTACALQIGHRISVDLDFFTAKEFDAKELIRSLKKIAKFKVERQSWGTILGTLEGIKFSIFVYKYPVLFPYKSIFGINILDLRDIAAMKIDAIGTRGIKRDFIDLYFICQEGISLKKVLSFYDRKYGTLASTIVHIQKSLLYFIDAEATAVPKILREVDWEEVKKYFEDEVKKLIRPLLQGPSLKCIGKAYPAG